MKNLRLFDAVYVRMTLWYVAIIMTISLVFSFWVYTQASNELRSGLKRTFQVEPLISQGPTSFGAVIEERLDDSRSRLLGNLVLLNTFVLVAGAAASYWLARRTMQPVEEAVEAQERFTADASHELRTPLAAMKTEIEVGLRDKALSKSDAVALLKSNLEEVDRLGNLAEGLLTLTQNDSTLTAKPVALEDTAGKAAKRLQPLADAKKVAVKRELVPVVITGDETAVDKIVSILLDNAIKYSLENTTVSLATSQKNGHGYVEVRDEGVGIKASELPHIFDRFYRADSSRSKTHVAGHGLGLSIAQRLAEQMGGKITASSAPGKGSVFYLKLPMPDAR